MELEQLRNSMKKVLSKSRFQHSLGVEEVSCDLAVINGYDEEKASIAGILHDCAKYLSDDQLIFECSRYQIPVKEVELKNIQLLHAKVGAAFASDIYEIEDEEILNAITYHSTGRPAMTVLEKIIFIADYIEPYRRPLPRINEIRKAAYEDLDQAVYMISGNVLNYLKGTGSVIDTLTNETYEYYKTVIQSDKK